MIELFFIVFYIKLRTFSYIKLYITFNRKRSKYYHKTKTSNQRFSPGRAHPSEKKSFFHLFPKILIIVVSTSTWSQNEGKYLYFMGMKEFLPESDFVYGLRTVLCDASSEYTCLSKSEKKKKFKYLPKIQIFTYTVLMRTKNKSE